MINKTAINTSMTLMSQSFGALFSQFVLESLSLMVPWLITMFAVVVLDLASGIAKSLKLGIEIRFSRFCRESIMKFTVYFAAVVAFCMFELASDMELATKCCDFIVFIELCSIFANILKMKGYNVNLNILYEMLVSKFTGADAKGIITKDEDGERN